MRLSIHRPLEWTCFRILCSISIFVLPPPHGPKYARIDSNFSFFVHYTLDNVNPFADGTTSRAGPSLKVSDTAAGCVMNHMLYPEEEQHGRFVRQMSRLFLFLNLYFSHIYYSPCDGLLAVRFFGHHLVHTRQTRTSFHIFDGFGL